MTLVIRSPIYCTVFGRTGLIGHAISQKLEQSFMFRQFEATKLSHDSSQIQEEVARNLRAFFAKVGPAQWRVVWAAGGARLSSDSAAAERDTDIFRAFLAALDDTSQQATRRGGVLVLSSAGALHGSSMSGGPGGLSPYAWMMFDREQLLLDFAQRSGHSSSVVRVANAYGPLRPGRPPRGVVQTIAACLFESRMFSDVSNDNRKNYVYSEDVAVRIVDSLRQSVDASAAFDVLWSYGPSSLRVSEIVSLAEALSGRRLQVQSESKGRPFDLSFEPGKYLPMSNFGRTPFSDGLAKVLASASRVYCTE